MDRHRHAQHDRLSPGAEIMNKFFSGRSACSALIVVSVVVVGAQIPADSWPTYHGDYSGRRYSTLKQITTGNVKGLTRAWFYPANTARAGAIVGGEGPETPPAGGPPQIKSTPLMIN